MAWENLHNHKSAIARFERSYLRNRLASTYLFVGPHGIGKRLFATKLAEVLLCENKPDHFDSCGTCPACQQVRAATHPDLIFVTKPKDKAFIPVELFIGDKEHRRQQGLCHDIGLKPFRGGRKIAIVDDADYLNQEGANSLLKTLEEPPPKSLLILIGSSEQQQLPTIISRSQVIRFDRLTTEEVCVILRNMEELETETPIESLAAASEGSVELALELAEPETFEFRKELFMQLATGDAGQSDFAKSILGFVDSAGKDAAKKRARLRRVADFAISFLRQIFLQASEIELNCEDPAVNSAVQSAIENWGRSGNQVAEIAATAIERSVDVQWQVKANANQANIVEAWLLDLGKICRGKALPV